MQITVLADQPAPAPLTGEFGLSLLLRQNGRMWLFDTGAGAALPDNLKWLGIDPAEITQVILSHGHYDHTGGLACLTPQRIWCGENIPAPQYSLHHDGSVHDISMPAAARKVFLRTPVQIMPTGGELAPGLFVSGRIPRISGEDCGGDFYGDPACSVPDTVAGEIALLTGDGVLITGCCHAGLINTWQRFRDCCPAIKIHTVVGGLHLRHADDHRLEQTAAFIRQSGISRLMLFHCTGDAAIRYLTGSLPGCRVSTPRVGETFTV